MVAVNSPRSWLRHAPGRLPGWFALCVGAAISCSDLRGLDPERPQLAALQVRVTGNLAAVMPTGEVPDEARLRVALVWLATPPLERFCLEALLGLGDGPPLSAQAFELAALGCRDLFGVAPGRVAASVAVEIGTVTELALFDLPTAADLIGTTEGRFGYATLVVFDDRNGDGTLTLRETERVRELDDGPNDWDGPNREGPADFVYAASFWSMSVPSWRVVFREGPGQLVPLFYPTVGCAEPPSGYSLRLVNGSPTTANCLDLPLTATVVELPLQVTQELREVACKAEPPRWRDPDDPLDLTGSYTCRGSNELILLNPPGECRGLTMYALKGCRQSADCESPDWDYTASPPKWWPCTDAVTP